MSATPTPVAFQVMQTQGASADTLLGATERLKQSRQKMRTQMLALNASSAQAQASTLAEEHSSVLMATLTSLPLIGPVIASAANWWANHPLHAVADLFMRSKSSATTTQKQGVMQRHPWAVLFGAVGVGALLMWTRPWRFGLLRRAVYAGLAPQIVGSLLSRVSGDGLLDLVNSVLRRSADTASPPPASKPRGTDESKEAGHPLH